MSTNFNNDQGDGYVGADGFVGPNGSGAANFPGYISTTPQLVAAAGSNSQTNSTAITQSLAIVTTVSATGRGVKLPAAATGLQVTVINSVATLMKVYPATGDKIGSASTNAATNLAASKSATYYAKNGFQWYVLTGA